MHLRVLVVVIGSLIAIGCGPPGDPGDPLGCELPEPCGTVELIQGNGGELEPREAAECIYETIVSGQPAHLRQVFNDTREITFDVYIRGDEPAVVTELDCEFDGPCMELEADRCVFEAPEYLDCSMDDGPPRVCGGAIEWCMSSSAIEAAMCP